MFATSPQQISNPNFSKRDSRKVSTATWVQFDSPPELPESFSSTLNGGSKTVKSRNLD